MTHIIKKARTVYKAARTLSGELALVTLRLPAGTRVNFAIDHMPRVKNRASRAKVVKIQRIMCKSAKRTAGRALVRAYSDYNGKFVYKVGATVVPDKFGRSQATCSNGIHFFRDMAQAIEYLVM